MAGTQSFLKYPIGNVDFEITPNELADDLKQFVTVVQSLHAVIPETDEGELCEAEETIRKSHRERKTIDFSTDKTQRLSYVFRYTMGHVLGTHRILNHMTNTGECKGYIRWLLDHENASLKICCVGGGPGTDVFALQSHLKWLTTEVEEGSRFPKKIKTPTIEEVSILDKCSEWQDIYNVLRGSLNLPVAKYVQFDFDKLLTPDDAGEWRESVRNADIVTLVKFAGTLLQNKSSDVILHIEQQLQVLLSEMKNDALLLYVDSNYPSFGAKVAKVARRVGFMQFLERSVNCNISGFAFGDVKPAKHLPLCVQLWWSRRHKT